MSKRNLNGNYPIPELGESVFFPSVSKINANLDKFQLRAWAAGIDVDWFRGQTVDKLLSGEITVDQLREMDLDALAKEAKAYHTVVSKEAMDYGSRVHAALDTYHKTGAYPIDPEIRQAFMACIEEEMELKQVVINSEFMVYSETHGYAGTLDLHCIKTISDAEGIVDYKTYGGEKAVVYPEHLLQIAAYVYALETMKGKFLDFGDIVYLSRETGLPTRKSFSRIKLINPFDRFRCLCEYFHLSKEKKKT